MKQHQLDEANRVSKEIDQLEGIIKSCETQKCEWIEFTFGNGSNKPMVCNDSVIIEKVKNLLISENLGKLKKLQQDFDKI